MAEISWSPGEVGTKVKTSSRKYRYVEQTRKAGDGGDPNYGSYASVQVPYVRSSRPSYPKGAFITLPDGSRFRRTTSYSTESFSIPEQSGGQYDTMYWIKPVTGSLWYVRGAQDEGRGVGYLVNAYPAIQGTSVPQDARNEAVTKALNKIGDQKLMLGENLATLGQTVRLFTDKSSLLLEALKLARRTKSWHKFLGKSAQEIMRAGPLNLIAQNYLAYVYGLKPLVNDVYTAAELMKSQAAKTLLLKGVGTARRMEAHGPKDLGPQTNCRIHRLGGTSSSLTKCTIWARLDPNGTSLRAMNQLGLLNPFSLAWELVPYSFVVDWFLPVGPVLNAMMAPAGLIFVDGSLSFRNTEISDFEYMARQTTIFYDESNTGQVAPKFEKRLRVQRTYEGFNRTPLGNWPRPGLYVDQDPFRADRPFKALALGILGLSGSRPPIR